MKYLWNVFVALDILGNVLTGGDIEPFCSRWARSSHPFSKWCCSVTDRIQRKHCWRSLTEGERASREREKALEERVLRIVDAVRKEGFPI